MDDFLSAEVQLQQSHEDKSQPLAQHNESVLMLSLIKCQHNSRAVFNKFISRNNDIIGAGY